MNKKRKANKKIYLLIILILGIIAFIIGFNKKSIKIDYMTKLNTIEDVNIIKNKYKMTVNTTYEYSDKVEKDKIISQSIKEGEVLTEGLKLDIVVSLGKLDKDKLASDNINELGKVPIMMYHGIRKKTSNRDF